MHPAKCLKKSGVSYTTNYPLQDGQQKERLKKKNKMNFTHEILQQMGYKVDANGNYSRTQTNTPRVSNPKPQPTIGKTLPNTDARKENSKKRSFVRITRYSCRPLDCDNYAGGCKPLIDQLRYAKLIRDDDPESVQIEFIQVKVSKKNQERTEVEIKEL